MPDLYGLALIFALIAYELPRRRLAEADRPSMTSRGRRRPEKAAMHLHLDNYLKHFGHLSGWTLMGTSIGAWLASNGMAILSAAGIVTSIVIQILTYRLKSRETEARLGASK